MTEPKAGQRPHFHFQGTGQPERFRSTASATRDPRFPRQDRVQHGGALLGQLHQVGEQMAAAINLQRQSGQDGGFGLQIEFKSFPGFELAFEGLRAAPSALSCSTYAVTPNSNRHGDGFHPRRAVKSLRKSGSPVPGGEHIQGQPRNAPLLNPIQEIRFAAFSALWTDDPAVLLRTIPTRSGGSSGCRSVKTARPYSTASVPSQKPLASSPLTRLYTSLSARC